ncbi:transcription antitermination factor NusB [Candidatus Daviesbacteria bacterium]|nr:transcription antitermination factor NusB [Candidatus Daviesbacteria bacterium]
MKTSKDPRHLRRIKIIQGLFARKESENLSSDPEINKVLKKIHANLAKIDQIIEKTAPSWPIDKINKIDLAILRLAIFELVFESITPPKVVVDEAIEIAKEYGSESSSSFVNGVLGKVITEEKIGIDK